MADIPENPTPTDWVALAIAAARRSHYDRAQAFAMIAQAQALVAEVPTTAEIEALIDTEVQKATEAIVGFESVRRIEEARGILREATRDGSRRHPAIHSALEVLGG